ncbi:hypothetical protein [Shewanella atlantica]|uniref:Uncharacterized protein n=1 Tax=Shewanella atlantica TaxID=271099 RepID=A0A431W586_9GAMM|nr:hypothetical protein [Shewanella atlantica]RTR30620.1 hypothetical protein EKG39_15465 [Shewanella atlantica]
MSSPIGGFYLNAQYRKKAEKFELSTKPKLSISIELQLDDGIILNESQISSADIECRFSTAQAAISLHPTVTSTGMIQLDSSIKIKHPDEDIAQMKQQVVNIESGETLSTLVEGNERIRLKISCNIC